MSFVKLKRSGRCENGSYESIKHNLMAKMKDIPIEDQVRARDLLSMLQVGDEIYLSRFDIAFLRDINCISKLEGE